MLSPILKTAATEKPITSAEVKAQIGIDSSDTTWDTLIDSLIAAATGYIDGWSGILGRCIVSQTWEFRFDCFEYEIDLPMPAASITSLQYYDTTDVLQTYSSSNYQLVQETDGSCICLYPTSTVPATSLNREDVVLVTAVCGYGAASVTPPAIKQALLMIVANWFANREAAVVGASVAELPFAATALLAPYRRTGI